MSNRVYTTSRHDDGTYTVTCFDKPIGFIQRVTLHRDKSRAYRCVTVLGAIFYRSSLDAAKRAILINYR